MIDSQKKHSLTAKFQEMIAQITTHFEINAIILFGSQAKGTANMHSDYDLLIIGNFKTRFVDRGNQLIDWLPDLPLDIFCYTPAEFHQMFQSYHLTVIDAVGEGIVLFGKEFLEPYRRQFEYFVKKGMKKLDYALIPPSL